MSVLEDAIREHLDLKRRHGAEEGELRQQEVEALGPARREAAASEEEGAEDAEAAPEAAAEEVEPVAVEEAGPGPTAPDADEDVAMEDAVVVEDEPPAEAPPEPVEEPSAHSHTPFDADVGPEQDEPFAEEQFADEAPPAELAPAEPEPADAATRLMDAPAPVEEPGPVEEGSFDHQEREPASGSTPPQGFPAVGEAEAPAPDEPAGEDEDEDVLEETPDFLQKSPEHDKLWFEQKPPRDFDFD